MAYYPLKVKDNSGNTHVVGDPRTSSKANTASPELTGTPTAPTAAADTNTTQIATTAFVVGQAGSSTPLVDGTATVGTSKKFARDDHRHPTDTSRAPLASPSLTGTPTAPTAGVGTNTTQVATTAFVNAEIANDAVVKALVNAKGDLITATADNTPARLAVGATNGHVLRVNSATATGLEWGAVESLPSQAGNANRLLTTNGTSASWTNIITNLINLAPEERFNVVAAAATGTININLLTAAVWFYTSNASANHTINFRGDASTTLNSLLATGDAITAVWMNTNGGTAFYPNVIQIDGSSVTPRWAGGSAPTSGNASSIDAYSFTIIKTAATPTYTVLGGQTRFA